MLKFIIDTQLPPKLSTYLVEKGFDSVHTSDFDSGHLLRDHAIIEIAIREGRIIITKDQDFFENYLLNGSPPRVIQLKFGNISNPQLLKLFEANLKEILSMLEEETELIVFSRKQLAQYGK